MGIEIILLLFDLVVDPLAELVESQLFNDLCADEELVYVHFGKVLYLELGDVENCRREQKLKE